MIIVLASSVIWGQITILGMTLRPEKGVKCHMKRNKEVKVRFTDDELMLFKQLCFEMQVIPAEKII